MSSLTLHYSWGHVYESYTLHMQMHLKSNRQTCWPTFLLLAVLSPSELKTVFRWKYKLFVNSASSQEMADAARCHSSQCSVTGAHLREPFHGSLIACFILSMWGAHTDFPHQALQLFHMISQITFPDFALPRVQEKTFKPVTIKHNQHLNIKSFFSYLESLQKMNRCSVEGWVHQNFSTLRSKSVFICLSVTKADGKCPNSTMLAVKHTWPGSQRQIYLFRGADGCSIFTCILLSEFGVLFQFWSC